MQRKANTGIITPERIDISLPSEKVSEIYEGIHVVTPSRREP